MVMNRAMVAQRVLSPLGKACPSLVHVAILGAWGIHPIMAISNMSQPIQQAHQSSFCHREDQSIRLFSLLIRSSSFHPFSPGISLAHPRMFSLIYNEFQKSEKNSVGYWKKGDAVE
jgi:hypothetical protein